MEKLILYLAEYAIYLAAFYLLYILLFKGKQDHDFNRLYLRASLHICLILPAIQYIVPSFQSEVFTVVLNPIEIGAKGTSNLIIAGNESFPLIKLLVGLYLSITSIFLLRFLYGIFKLYTIRKNGLQKRIQHYHLVESSEVKVPFSFYETIYLPQGSYQGEELEVILEHELTHIRLDHSREKMTLLAHKVLFWWNPIAYKYYTEIELIHEYQVDERLCQKSNKQTYGQFLLAQFQSLDQTQHSFVNNISSHIKNRIVMLSKTNKSTPAFLRWGSFLGLLAILLFVHACTTDNEDPMTATDKVVKNIEHITDNSSTAEDFYMETVIDTVVTFHPDTYEETVQIVKSENKVYKKPDVMPIFGDCMSIDNLEERAECSQQNLLTFVYTNIKYPEEARAKSVEGVVVAKFVIDEKGWMRSPKIVRPIGSGCDAQVMSILKKMWGNETKWTPGQQDGKNVSTVFHLPVKFKLE